MYTIINIKIFITHFYCMTFMNVFCIIHFIIHINCKKRHTSYPFTHRVRILHKYEQAWEKWDKKKVIVLQNYSFKNKPKWVYGLKFTCIIPGFPSFFYFYFYCFAYILYSISFCLCFGHIQCMIYFFFCI